MKSYPTFGPVSFNGPYWAGDLKKRGEIYLKCKFPRTQEWPRARWDWENLRYHCHLFTSTSTIPSSFLCLFRFCFLGFFFFVSMAGKGGKGLVAGKTTAANKDKDKDKKRPVSRSSRAGIQVTHLLFFSDFVFFVLNCPCFQPKHHELNEIWLGFMPHVFVMCWM